MFLFVYGTLMKKYVEAHASSMLKKMEATYVDEATIYGKLYDIGWFPGVIIEGAEKVHGELWKISPDMLSKLDLYEGCENNSEGSLYCRERVPVCISNKVAPDFYVEAIVYTYNKGVLPEWHVPSGDYFKHKMGS